MESFSLLVFVPLVGHFELVHLLEMTHGEVIFLSNSLLFLTKNAFSNTRREQNFLSHANVYWGFRQLAFHKPKLKWIYSTYKNAFISVDYPAFGSARQHKKVIIATKSAPSEIRFIAGRYGRRSKKTPYHHPTAAFEEKCGILVWGFGCSLISAALGDIKGRRQRTHNHTKRTIRGLGGAVEGNDSHKGGAKTIKTVGPCAFWLSLLTGRRGISGEAVTLPLPETLKKIL